MHISSPSNSKVKTVVSLRNHKKRESLGISIVEGIREISRALESTIVLKEVFVCKELIEASGDPSILKKILSLKIPLAETTTAVFEKMCYGDRSEGILAIFETPQSDVKNLRVKKNSLFVVVETIEKPGNLGAILRTCDGAGVDGMIVCEQKTDVFNPNIIRASLGAVFTVPTVIGDNEETYHFLKSNEIKIISSLPEAKKNYSKSDMTGSVAIVMGSEQAGLSGFWREKADEKVMIPMKGKVDSLNVSTSAAILIYEALRQRS